MSSMPPVTHAPPLQIAVSPTRVAVGRALRHGSFWVGGLIILVIFLAAIFAPWLTPYDPSIQDLGQRFVAPVWAEGGSWAHPLGTDGLGRDYLTRLLFGARISLMIGFLTILISGTIGTAMGVAAGYWGGWVDLVVNFIITAIVMRSATQQLASREYITSARTIGSSTSRILIREILPNIMGPLIVVASIELAHAILLEAALSFLGLGVQPPNVSWGLMVAEAKSQLLVAEAKAQLLFRPWMIAVPGAALVLLIFAINLVGDALRDVTTPEGKA